MELWDRVTISREEYENSIKDFIEKEKLQQRIDKAVEYIKENSCELETILGSGDWQIRVVNELLEILKGE